MLYIIGLGLGDESDITLRGLEAVKKSQKIYMDRKSFMGNQSHLLIERWWKKGREATTHSDLVVRPKKLVKEPTFESLCRGGKKQYEPPRYMTVNTAIEQLLEVEQKRGDSVYSEETECVGFARLGAEDQKILSGTMKQSESVDCGAPLHCLVIVGKTHPVEEEMLEFYIYGTAN
ncbi:BnaC08g14220D [Brassica napus]|uniref:BnaC08g14220D protein n=1 Tax=Brassica napus TaxID=3708 RepID=A0A078G5B3_BRANA|nr:BnaC08g14220D [Brassica napus]